MYLKEITKKGNLQVMETPKKMLILQVVEQCFYVAGFPICCRTGEGTVGSVLSSLSLLHRKSNV